MHVNGTPATIVGVMPQGFDFPQRTDLWMPLKQTADLHRVVANGSFVFGRLADGVSEATARTEVTAINARLAAEFPATNRDVYPLVQNFMDSFAGPNASVIYGSLWAGAWLVLAIAYANVANLALARAQSRARETRTRMALGAGRGRVARQWLVEGLLLAAVAGFRMPVAAGLVLGLAASLAVNRVLQSQLVDVSPYDALTLALAPSILALVALVGCLFPLRQAVRVDPVVALRHD